MTEKSKNNELMMEAIELALFTKRAFKVMAKINIFDMEKPMTQISTKQSTQVSRSVRRKRDEDDDDEVIYQQNQVVSVTQEIPIEIAEKVVSMVFTKIKKARVGNKSVDQKLSLAQKKLIQDLISNPADVYNYYLYILTII